MKTLLFTGLLAMTFLATSCQKADQAISPQAASARQGADNKPGDDKGNQAEPKDDKRKHKEPGDDKGGHKEPGDDKGGANHG